MIKITKTEKQKPKEFVPFIINIHIDNLTQLDELKCALPMALDSLENIMSVRTDRQSVQAYKLMREIKNICFGV